MAERSDDHGRKRFATLRLSEAAPDPVGLLDLEGVGSAITDHGTDLADSLRTDLSSLPFILAFLGTWWEEEVGVVAAA